MRGLLAAWRPVIRQDALPGRSVRRCCASRSAVIMNVQKLVMAREGHAVILCHPDPHGSDDAIATRQCEAGRAGGQEVVLRDLYAMGFDPILVR